MRSPGTVSRTAELRYGRRDFLAASDLRETAGSQHFQHLLGYRARTCASR